MRAHIAIIALAGSAMSPVSADTLVAHVGRSVGYEQEYSGLNHYISEPPYARSSIALLYLTDVFGIQLPQNRLLVDSFARAGFFTVAPDLFDGNPAPQDINAPGSNGFNTTQFLAMHQPNTTDPKIATSIDYLRNTLGFAKVAVAGYCYGGRYVFRALAEGKGVDVGFTAHPSGVSNGEIAGMSGPASIAFAENDNMLSAQRRAEMEQLLRNGSTAYSSAVYAGTMHGFGVRANVSDPKQRFAKEEAFKQAVSFFNAWA